MKYKKISNYSKNIKSKSKSKNNKYKNNKHIQENKDKTDKFITNFESFILKKIYIEDSSINKVNYIPDKTIYSNIDNFNFYYKNNDNLSERVLFILSLRKKN